MSFWGSLWLRRMHNYKNRGDAGGLRLPHPLILLQNNRKLFCVVAIETSNCCTWQIAGHFKAVNSVCFLGSSRPTGLTCDSVQKQKYILKEYLLNPWCQQSWICYVMITYIWKGQLVSSVLCELVFVHLHVCVYLYIHGIICD